jgi:ATP-dependent Lon protease
VIPADNEKDLAEIPDNVKRGLKIIPVRTVDEVLKEALAAPLTPIEWEAEAATPPVIPGASEERPGVLTH